MSRLGGPLGRPCRRFFLHVSFSQEKDTSCPGRHHPSRVDIETGDVQLASSEGMRGVVRETAVDGRSRAFSKHEAVSALLQGGAGYDALDSLRGGMALYDPRASFYLGVCG